MHERISVSIRGEAIPIIVTRCGNLGGNNPTKVTDTHKRLVPVRRYFPYMYMYMYM